MTKPKVERRWMAWHPDIGYCSSLRPLCISSTSEIGKGIKMKQVEIREIIRPITKKKGVRRAK